jgi:hypothetical protein
VGAGAAAVAQTAALVGQVGAKELKVELETLQQFKNKVDGILQDLDGSDASHNNISQQALRPDQLGVNFGQASDLTGAYNQVHNNLEQLSQTLALQIQAMSASIDMAAQGYSNTDDEQKAKYQAILNQAGAAAQAPTGGANSPAAAGPGSYASPATYNSPSTAQPTGGANQAGGY